MVRRMKSELELRWDGTRRFAKRCVKHLGSAPIHERNVRASGVARIRRTAPKVRGHRQASDSPLNLS